MYGSDLIVVLTLNMKNSHSHMLRIGPRCNVNISPVTVYGLLLSVTNDMSYLGVDFNIIDLQEPARLLQHLCYFIYCT